MNPVNPPTSPPTNPPIHQSINQPTHPPNYWPTNPSVNSPINSQPTHPSVVNFTMNSFCLCAVITLGVSWLYYEEYRNPLFTLFIIASAERAARAPSIAAVARWTSCSRKMGVILLVAVTWPTAVVCTVRHLHLNTFIFHALPLL